MELFDGDEEKVEQLEQKIAEKIGFSKCQSVSGQTYTRKADFAVLQVLSGIAQSASKFSGDIRLRSEHNASMARFVICDLHNTAIVRPYCE